MGDKRVHGDFQLSFPTGSGFLRDIFRIALSLAALLRGDDGQAVFPAQLVAHQEHRVLGVVTNRYKVVQNEEAFAFMDRLLGEGVTYETAGSLQDGCRTWILAKLSQRYIISGDEITPYLVFMNSHDGTGVIKRRSGLPVRSVGRSARVTIGRTVRCVEEERMKFDEFKEKVKKEMQEYFQDQCEIHASLSAPHICYTGNRKRNGASE